MTNYTLYATPLSLYSGKARAYLRWKNVSFDEVLTTREVMQDILPVIGWPVIPIMRLDSGTLVQDTGDIITHVEADHPTPPVMPGSPLQDFISEILHVYGDEWLTIPAMHYRWHYNEDFTYAEFGKTVAPNADTQTQYEIGKKNGAKFKGFVPMLGITEDTIPAIESSYKAFLSEFSNHLDEHPFLMGARPSLADFSFYGPLYAHLYRDPASGDIMKALAPNVVAWVERLLTADYGDGELASNDCIPETLYPLLKRHFAEHLPVLQRTNALLAAWAENQSSGAEIPRALGMAEFSIGDTNGQTLAKTFSLYRLQAAMDKYEGLSAADKEKADHILETTGGGALKEFKVAARLTRKNYKLVLA